MGYSLIHLETRHTVAVLDFNPTAAISKNTPRGMSFEGLENRTELKSEWRSNPLPNNTVPGAIHIKLLSNATYIVTEHHKDRAWPIFLLFQNLFPLTFCCCFNCCLSPFLPHWHFLLWLVNVVFLHLPFCCLRDLAVAAMSLKWPGALQRSHFPGDGRVYGLRLMKAFLTQGQTPPPSRKQDRGLFVPPFPPHLNVLKLECCSLA